jgi:predicted nucleic acid-binding OB-fold protein
MTGGPYVRIQVDESLLDKVFKQVEVRLDQHEAWIIELQNLMRNKADRSELKELYELLQKELNSRFSETNNRLKAIESQLDGAIRDLETKMNERFTKLQNSFDEKLREQIAGLEAKIPQNDPRLDQLLEKVKQCEGGIDANTKKLHLTRESVQHIASSIAYLNKSQALLDSTLPDVLRGSVNYVNNNFAEIFNELEKIRDRQQIASIMERMQPPAEAVEVIPATVDVPTEAEPVVVAPSESGEPPAAKAELPPEKPGEHVTIEKKTILRQIVGGAAIDLSEIWPYPPVSVHWTDPPELPAVRKFQKIEEVVDFVYRLVPKLQAHLTAIHRKVVELNTDLVDKVDRALVERMFDRFQGAMGEIKSRFDDMKDVVEQTASRDEINHMVEDLFHALNVDHETSVGRVKCIACGRETTRVTGALTEGDVARALGNPPNSIAFRLPNPTQPVGVVYSSKEGFDSAITESPRSVRPYRAIQVRPKVKTPAVPPPG